MEVNFNKGQEKSSKPQSIQESIFLFVDEVFFDGLQLSVFLPSQQTTPHHHQKVVPHRNICSSCLSVEYCLGVPEVDPNKKPRKIFFIKNDYAQYERKFIICIYYLYSSVKLLIKFRILINRKFLS